MKKIDTSEYYYIDDFTINNSDIESLDKIETQLYNDNVIAIEGYITEDIAKNNLVCEWASEIIEKENNYYIFKIINYIEYINFSNFYLKMYGDNGRMMKWI